MADPTQTQGGVFISHVHEDQEIADAFATMIHDITAGAVPTFSSSSTSGSGIKYGTEWFQWIRQSIDVADHIVALLTPNSLERPWILFETGLGKGRETATVFGLAIGVPLGEASVGPFQVFHNSASDRDSLVKLSRQLIERAPVNPRDAVIEQIVEQFLAKIEGMTIAVKESAEDTRTAAVLQAIEDLKFLVGAQREAAPRRGSPRQTAHHVSALLRLADETWDVPPVMRMEMLADLAGTLDLGVVAAALRTVVATARYPSDVPLSLVTRTAYDIVADTRPRDAATDLLLMHARRLLDTWDYDLHAGTFRPPPGDEDGATG